MIRLASAILIQTIKDIENDGYQEDIEEFIKSPWFDQLVMLSDLDPDQIRQQIEGRAYQSINLRAAYR